MNIQPFRTSSKLLFTLFFSFLGSNVLLAQISFAPYQAIKTGDGTESVCMGDVNNDGLKDVVVSAPLNRFSVNEDYSIFVYLQNASGKLDSPMVYISNSTSTIEALTIDDVNNDKLNDVIIGYQDSIAVFFQNTAGSLQPMQKFYSGKGVYGVKTGDLNNDKKVDIVVANSNSDTLTVFYQTNNNQFIRKTFLKPSGVWLFGAIDVGDVNDDGLADVVYMSGQQMTGGIHVFTQNKMGDLNNYVSYFQPKKDFNSLNSIVIDDANNDGKNDVIASMGGNSPTAKIIMWFQNPTTHLLDTNTVEISAYDIPQPITMADLNCDGTKEIITAHGGFRRLTVYEQNSSEKYGTYKIFFTSFNSHYNPQAMSVGDINNDGKKDVVLADFSGSNLVIMMNTTKQPANTPIDSMRNFTKIDTFFKQTLTNIRYFTTTKSDMIGDYLVLQTDSFRVTQTIKKDSIRTDSVLIKISRFCSEIQRDTTTKTTYKGNEKVVRTDTTFISSKNEATFVDLETPFKIYPNPTNGVINIDLAPPFNTENTSLKIYNELGQLVYSELFEQKKNRRQIDLTYLANSIYFLRFSTAEAKLTYKIVKID